MDRQGQVSLAGQGTEAHADPQAIEKLKRLTGQSEEQMPYAAAIKPADNAPKDAIEDIAPSFSSAIANIRRRENE